MAEARPLCADTARERGDPIVGTALHVRRFLLIEHPGPWPLHALEAEGITEVAPELVAATAAVGARTFLVRRPGRQVSGRQPRRWAVADVTADRILWGAWEHPSDLLGSALPGLHAASGDWPSDPVLLVCAHGRHDTCCAVRGRPVAAALAERWPDATWECSHVGGDRFAANLVVVPDGSYYGALDPASATDVVAAHLEGRVSPTFLRGSITLPPAAQAVAAAACERWGPAGPRSVTDHRCTLVGERQWSVELRAESPLPPRITATVRAVVAPAALLTCRAPRATSAHRYEVADLRGDPGAAAPAG